MNNILKSEFLYITLHNTYINICNNMFKNFDDINIIVSNYMFLNVYFVYILHNI